MKRQEHIKLNKLISAQKGERCALVVRKHWFVFLSEVAGAVFAVMLTLAVLQYMASSGLLAEAQASFWQALALLCGVLTSFVIWTNYYLDMWIVTNKRVLHVDQLRLFSRMVAATRIDRVQDVKVKISGIIPTLLKFGNLHMQTAGTNTAIMHIRGIPYPNQVRKVILKYLDQSIDSHKPGLHNKDGIGHN